MSPDKVPHMTLGYSYASHHKIDAGFCAPSTRHPDGLCTAPHVIYLSRRMTGNVSISKCGSLYKSRHDRTNERLAFSTNDDTT